MDKHNHIDLTYWFFYSALHVWPVYISHHQVGTGSQKELKNKERPLLTVV
jgi:hypothetical protein